MNYQQPPPRVGKTNSSDIYQVPGEGILTPKSGHSDTEEWFDIQEFFAPVEHGLFGPQHLVVVFVKTLGH